MHNSYNINHVSKDTLSDILFDKAFKRDDFLMNSYSESQYIYSRQYHVKFKEIVKQCHDRSKIVEISQNPDTGGLKSRHYKIGVFSNQLQVDFLSYFSQYLEFRAEPRLYIHLQELPDTTRVFLVLLLSSRVCYRPLFTSGVPCDNSEMSVLDRS